MSTINSVEATSSRLTTRRKMPRPRIQRAFLKWMEVNRSCFAIDIRFGRRTDKFFNFSFVGVTGEISGYLSAHELNVAVEYDGWSWDSILWPEVAPIRAAGGYTCAWCLPEAKTIFPDLNSLYADHLFKPLLKWVNEDLAKAKWLLLVGKPGKSTYAELTAAPPEGDELPTEEFRLIPLRAAAASTEIITAK